MHCSNLAAQGLHAAIKDYLERTGRPVPEALVGLTEEAEEPH
jgi:hypothetical protein